MKLRNIFYSIKKIAINLSFFLFSIYVCLLLSPLIKIFYSNQYKILGSLTSIRYNPINNIARFYFILIFSTLFFLFLKYLYKKEKITFLALIFIFTLTLSFLLREIRMYIPHFMQIDMFHIGENIGPGAAAYFFNYKPFKDIFFLHGAFSDPLLASFSFHIFKPSIGSFYLFQSLIKVITFCTFFTTFFLITKNKLIFLFGSIFFFGSIVLGSDLFVLIFICLTYLILQKKINEYVGFLILGLVSFLSFYYSIDRAFYIFASSMFFLIMSSIFLLINEKNTDIFLKLKMIIKWTLFYLCGLIIAIIIGVVYFGIPSMIEFFKMTFIDIPRFSSLMFDYKFPYLTKETLYPFYLPIFLIVFNLILLICNPKKLFSKKNNPIIFPLTILFLSIISFKSALGRSDLGHFFYIFHFIFLSLFVTFDYIIFFGKIRLTYKIIIYSIILLFYFFPSFNFEKIIFPPSYETHDLRIYFDMPNMSDDYWLQTENIKVSDYIMKNTNENDFIFDFTNQAAFYYLIKRRNPTRFFMVWFADMNYYEKQALRDLNKNKPKFIIYKSNFWSNNIDNITNMDRVPLMNAWILKNYRLDTIIDSTEIFILKK